MQKISVIAYFSHCYLCRRRHKVAMIAEQNWKFCSRFLRRKTTCGMEIRMEENEGKSKKSSKKIAAEALALARFSGQFFLAGLAGCMALVVWVDPFFSVS